MGSKLYNKSVSSYRILNTSGCVKKANQKMFYKIIFVSFIFKISTALICKNGQQISYMVTSDSALPYTLASSLKKSRVTIDQCKKACTSTSECSSLMYESATKSCTLNRRMVQSGNQLIFISGTEYYEKICLTVDRKICSDNLLRIPQQFLVGFARDVSTVPKFEDCIAKCFETIEPYHDFNCASLIYYYEDKSCILNAETVRNYPDLLTAVEPDEGRVDYLDNDCFQGWAQWTYWGTCFPNGTQIRQRFCTANNGVCSGSSYDSQPCRIEDGGDAKPHTITNCPEQRFYFGCNQYCQNFAKLGYNSYPDCLRGQGKPKSQSQPRIPRSVQVDDTCRNYLSLGYGSYRECLRAKNRFS